MHDASNIARTLGAINELKKGQPRRSPEMIFRLLLEKLPEPRTDLWQCNRLQPVGRRANVAVRRSASRSYSCETIHGSSTRLSLLHRAYKTGSKDPGYVHAR